MTHKGDEGGVTREQCIEWLEQSGPWNTSHERYMHSAILAHLRTPSAQDGPVSERTEVELMFMGIRHYVSQECFDVVEKLRAEFGFRLNWSDSVKHDGLFRAVSLLIQQDAALRPAPAEPAPVPCASTAEVEALEAGADACNFQIRDSSMPAKWREWETSLRNLAARLKGE